MQIVADENIPFVTEFFASLGQVQTLPGREITAEKVKDADTLIVRSVTPVDEKLLAGSKVKFVGTATIGVEHIDTNWLSKRGIAFASAPGSNANSVAEYVVAALLTIAEKHKVKLAGKSIGIIGVGNVGTRVARKAAGLDMKTVLNDPPLKRQTDKEKYRPLNELFDCDFITLHTPLTFEGIDKTYHLANTQFFAALKEGAYFLNTARGAVTDTDALKDALQSGKLGGAVLDVWENEPDIDTELLQMVDIGTPHIAGYSLDGKTAGTVMIYMAMCKHFGLEPERNAADFLGPAPVSNIQVEPSDDEKTIASVVRQVYDIEADDERLRGLMKTDAQDRAAYFDGLRKNYPARREFQNTKVTIRKGDSKLAEKLQAIGFVRANTAD